MHDASSGRWPRRGSVYRGDLPGQLNRTFMVVSSDARNQSWPTVLVALIVEDYDERGLEPFLSEQPSVVLLEDLEPTQGVVMLDVIFTIRVEHLHTFLGRVTHDAVAKINAGLVSVFDIPPFDLLGS